ncbi:hypothetical protein SANTM175S_00513 [Streptomyces antimycoticus]
MRYQLVRRPAAPPLQDDRLLTVDFRPEVYTPLGLDWVEKSSMTSVILRHCPELAGVLPRGGESVRALAARGAVAVLTAAVDRFRFSPGRGSG